MPFYWKIVILAFWVSASLISCTSLSNNTLDGLSEQPAEDQKYADHFDRLLSLLHTSGNNSGSNGVIVLVAPTFAPLIAISIDQNESFDDSDIVPILTVSVWNHPNDSHEEIGDVYTFKSMIERYLVELTRAEFDTIIQSFIDLDFQSLSTRTLCESSGTDGITYYVSTFINKNQKLIVRHVGEPGYVEDSIITNSLFDLANSKFPMISEYLHNAQSSLKNSYSC